MPSEFGLDLVFIRKHTAEPHFAEAIQTELERMFAGSATWFMETKREQELDICVVEISGLAAWSSETEAINDLESRMQSECWDWLSGYRLQVIEKEDVGACRLKKGGELHGLDGAAD